MDHPAPLVTMVIFLCSLACCLKFPWRSSLPHLATPPYYPGIICGFAYPFIYELINTFRCSKGYFPRLIIPLQGFAGLVDFAVALWFLWFDDILYGNSYISYGIFTGFSFVSFTPLLGFWIVAGGVKCAIVM